MRFYLDLIFPEIKLQPGFISLDYRYFANLRVFCAWNNCKLVQIGLRKSGIPVLEVRGGNGGGVFPAVDLEFTTVV